MVRSHFGSRRTCVWPSFFGGFLRGGAFGRTLARSRRSWTAVPRLGPALRRRHFGSSPRRLSSRRFTLACAVAAAPSLRGLLLALRLRRTRGKNRPRVVARATTLGPGGIGEQTPPSSSLAILPPRPGPYNPQPLRWAGRFRLSPRAKGRGATPREATTRNFPRDQHLPRFFQQDLQV